MGAETASPGRHRDRTAPGPSPRPDNPQARTASGSCIWRTRMNAQAGGAAAVGSGQRIGVRASARTTRLIRRRLLAPPPLPPPPPPSRPPPHHHPPHRLTPAPSARPGEVTAPRRRTASVAIRARRLERRQRTAAALLHLRPSRGGQSSEQGPRRPSRPSRSRLTPPRTRERTARSWTGRGTLPPPSPPPPPPPAPPAPPPWPG